MVRQQALGSRSENVRHMSVAMANYVGANWLITEWRNYVSPVAQLTSGAVRYFGPVAELRRPNWAPGVAGRGLKLWTPAPARPRFAVGARLDAPVGTRANYTARFPQGNYVYGRGSPQVKESGPC